MGKQNFKTIKLILKLILLFHIYVHHNFTEASESDSPKSFKKRDVIRVGTGFKYQETKNETAENVLERSERPARLLPLRVILGKEKNKNDSENTTSMRFYGPATSCEELLKIGYTRNGFYLVKGNATSNSSYVEMVDCMFKNPNGAKEVREKRLGFIPLKYSADKFRQRRSIQNFAMVPKVEVDEMFLGRPIRPARLLPSHLYNGRYKNDTEEQNIVQRFYGPPCNCSELGRLGYTLNGYYLVNGSKTSSHIELIFCRFKLPPGENDANEERLGFISLDQVTATIDRSQSIKEHAQIQIKEIHSNKFIPRNLRPARILPNKNYLKGKQNNTDTEGNKIQRLDRNHLNCVDIGMVGNTLNGYYLVNSSVIGLRFGVVFCQFKLPPGATKILEETLGFVDLLDVHTINQVKDAQDSTQNGYFNKITSTTSETTEESDADSSEVIDTSTTSATTTKQFTEASRKIVNNPTTKSLESLDAKKHFLCIRQKKQLYYLKNNYTQSTCLALERKNGKVLRVARINCDGNRLEMRWIKQESTNKNIQGAFHICQSLNNNMKCLSDVPKNLNNARNSFAPLDMNSYIDANTATIASRYQQWRLNTKTNQIVNVETRLCLTSFDSKPLSNTSNARFLAASVGTCTKGSNGSMQQQWFFDPIPKC